jgi:hypothetical protein
MISGTQQRSAAKARIVTVKYDRLQLPNGEYVEGSFDKIEYTDEGNDIFNVTHKGITQKMKLVDNNLIKIP